MADVKISALPAGSVPGVTDVLPMVQGGVTNKVTVAQLFTNPVQQTYEDFTGIADGLVDLLSWRPMSRPSTRTC